MGTGIELGVRLNANGDLDLTGVTIVTTADGDLTLSPDGTGRVLVTLSGTSALRLEDSTAAEYTTLSQEEADGDFVITRRGTGGIDFSIDKDGNVCIGTVAIKQYQLTSAAEIGMLERSSDPAEPSEGVCVMWMSDGTEKGDDGDVLIASRVAGVTRYGTLFDHSAGAAW